MGDFLAELFDQFDAEEQARIRAAEGAVKGILAQGTADVADRLLAAGSSVLSDWALEPEHDAQADAAGVVFVAYVHGLWRQTDATRSESIQGFLARVDKLTDVLRATYGKPGEALITQLRARCHMAVDLLVQRIAPTETLGVAEQGEMREARVRGSGDLIMSVQPNAILEFAEFWRLQQRDTKKRQAAYDRRRRNPAGAEKHEELLRHTRPWAKVELTETLAEVHDVFELKERVAKRTFDKFVQEGSYFWRRYSEFASALLEEGWPSLEDRAIEAIAERARSAAKAQSSSMGDQHLVRQHLVAARSKVCAVRDSLASGSQTPEQEAASLELEARTQETDSRLVPPAKITDAILPNEFNGAASEQPLGENPFPPEHAAENAARQEGGGKRRGRRPNPERRDAIRSAIAQHGDAWRDHLGEICKELDTKEVPLGDFQSREIDVGDGQNAKVSKWEDLDLSIGEQRGQIIDALRKYTD